MASEKRTRQATNDTAGMERLQKVLAARGVASRRAAEELIVEGRVTVDGRVVSELGTKVDPARSAIRVAGRLLHQPKPRYLVLNKPRGYLTTASDPEGRRTVYDLLAPGDRRERVFPVGRLDMDSEGLLLLTNDGEFANRVAHPRYRLDKEYHALVTGHPSPAALAQLRRGGFMLDGGQTSPAAVEVLEQTNQTTLLRVVIHEGRRRQVRRIMEEIGHPVLRLRRVRLGPLTLAGLPAAAYRPLSGAELARLRQMVRLGGAGEEAESRPEGGAKPGFLRVNEPRALAEAKRQPQGTRPQGARTGGPRRERAGQPDDGGPRRDRRRENGRDEGGPGQRDRRGPRRDGDSPRRESPGHGGPGGRGRGEQGRGGGGRPARGGGKPAGGGGRPGGPRRPPAGRPPRRDRD